MTKGGLVLAGGGLAGITWETGILQGIADEAPDAARALLAADVLLGTSAGSTVVAQIGSGNALGDLYAAQVEDATWEIDPGVNIDDITNLFVSELRGTRGVAARDDRRPPVHRRRRGQTREHGGGLGLRLRRLTGPCE